MTLWNQFRGSAFVRNFNQLFASILIQHIFTEKRQSIPLVPFNAVQNKILVYQPFVLLLHKLGFHLPADANKLYVRIPEFWTAEMLFSVAEKLGPIQECKEHMRNL